MTRRILPLMLILAAYALRVARLDAQELRGDEAFGYFFSLASPAEIVSRTLELAEPHPVASYWLQHGWLKLAGHSEFSLRYPSAWWSILAVALLLALAARLDLSEANRLAGGALAAVSPYLIWHAQDARMYSMNLALTTAATVAAVAWWARPGWRSGAVYVVSGLLALHTHYYAAYVILAHGAAVALLALIAKRPLVALRFGGLLLALGLLFLPWLFAANQILTGYTGNGDSPTLLDAGVRAHAALLTGATTPPGYRWLPALLLLSALGVGAVHLGRARPMAAIWLLVGWSLPLGLTWLSAQARPIFDERYLVAVAPPIYLLAGAAVEARYRRLAWPRLLWGLCLVAMVVGLARSWTLPAYSKDRGWRALAVRLEQLTQGLEPASARLVQNYPDPTLWYYYAGPVPHLVLPPQANNLDAARAEVARMAADGVRHVVLVEQPSAGWDADRAAQTALRDHYAPVAETYVADWPLVLYARPPDALGPVDAAFANGLLLVEATVEPDHLPAGGWLTVHLGWSGSVQENGQEQGAPLAVSVQLLDAAGQLVAQQDQPLPALLPERTTRVSYGILTPPSLAAGTYRLTVVLYDPDRPNAAPVPLEDGRERVVIATGRIQ